MRVKKGFSLIELLVVIAIIALLAAIIFPVYSQAKVSAARNGDIARMNALRTALQLYRQDYGGYPPALLGYATTYTPGGNDVVPAGQLKGFLYPKRVDSLATFRPAQNRDEETLVTTAVFPAQDPRPVGSAPLLDLNGDGAVDANDDTLGARQAFGPADGPVCKPGFGPPGNCANDPFTNQPAVANFYALSGFEAAPRPDSTGERYELRYALFWTNFAIGTSDPSFGRGSAFDDPRQLGYSEPPDTTVVLWNSTFRDYDGDVLKKQGTRDLALFLGGGARSFDSAQLDERSWRVLPR
jgi:prepilin-type N-terminal cleavage/methylation domain-containing protein